MVAAAEWKEEIEENVSHIERELNQIKFSGAKIIKRRNPSIFCVLISARLNAINSINLHVCFRLAFIVISVVVFFFFGWTL